MDSPEIGTPWEVKGIGHNVYIETVSAKPDGGFICDLQADEFDTPEERARIDAIARRIVLAVNCHDDLLAERTAIRDILGGAEWGSPEHAEQLLEELINKFCESPAIAKAEGRQT